MTRRRFRIVFYLAISLFILLSAMPSKKGIDPEFNIYLDAVEEFSNGNLKRIPNINFGRLESGTLGACNSNILYEEILINKNHWTYSSYHDRVILLAHELTHCYKKVMHVNGLMSDGCAYSYMNSHDEGSNCNKRHFKRYINEMQEI